LVFGEQPGHFIADGAPVAVLVEEVLELVEHAVAVGVGGVGNGITVEIVHIDEVDAAGRSCFLAHARADRVVIELDCAIRFNNQIATAIRGAFLRRSGQPLHIEEQQPDIDRSRQQQQDERRGDNKLDERLSWLKSSCHTRVSLAGCYGVGSVQAMPFAKFGLFPRLSIVRCAVTLIRIVPLSPSMVLMKLTSGVSGSMT
jgi:hypothetical protein